MEIGPIFSSLLRSRTGPLLVALQVALSLAILANALFVVEQRIAVSKRPSGVDSEQDVGYVFSRPLQRRSHQEALAEHGSKVGESERKAIEDAIADLKEALKGDNADAIQAKTNALAQASMKLGEAMYKAQQDAGPGDPGASAGEPGKKEDVVDAEFTEVDDDKKNQKSA